MEQKKMKIHEFSKGDIITRITESKPYPTLYGDSAPDKAYIGKALEFIGIANGCLYVKPYIDENKRGSSDLVSIFSLIGDLTNKTINLNLDIWEDGWSYYIDPETMETISKKTKETNNFSNYSKEELEEKLQNALEEEKYEEAEKLKKELKKFS